MDFWQIIRGAKQKASAVYDRPEGLRLVLKELNLSELKEFSEIYRSQLNVASTWSLWEAAYVMHGTCSKEYFEYFRDWLISEGQEAFENALANPDSLAALSFVEDPELEEYRYVVSDVFKDKTGENLPEIANINPTILSGIKQPANTIHLRYPRLTVIYSNS